MSRNTTLSLASAAGLLLAATAAQAAPPQPDPTSIWTIQDENASLSSASLTDRYYVNGLRIGYTSGTDVPDWVNDAGRFVWGDGQQRISINVSQQIYTPAATQYRNPPIGDEPYAGYLYATVGLLHDGDNTRSVLSGSIGLIGPGAGASEVQNGFHSIIGQGTTKGFNYQLHNEPAVQFLGDRVWRVPVSHFGLAGGTFETDVLPQVQAQVGTVHDYVLGGGVFRIGQGLESDYGVARLTPGMTGSDVFTPVRPLAWYAFAGLDGRAIAHDELLQGNDFASSRHVTMKPLVGDISLGAAVIWHGVRLSYAHVLETTTFSGEHGGLHQFGSLALSARF